MRRIVVFILLIFVIVACGGKDDKTTTVAPSNTPNLPPTLPPQQTVDPLQQSTVGLPSPTVLLVTRTPASRGPTLPPVASPTVLIPTATATITLAPPMPTDVPIVIPTLPEACATFLIDLAQTTATIPLRAEPVSVYWFAPQGTNITYQVQLFNHINTLIFEDTTTNIFYTFVPEVFGQGANYYWQVIAYSNNVSMGCVPVGNELFLH